MFLKTLELSFCQSAVILAAMEPCDGMRQTTIPIESYKISSKSLRLEWTNVPEQRDASMALPAMCLSPTLSCERLPLIPLKSWVTPTTLISARTRSTYSTRVWNHTTAPQRPTEKRLPTSHGLAGNSASPATGLPGQRAVPMSRS